MTFSSTLNRYLARSYLFNFLFMLGILLGLIYVIDTLELLRRASKQDGIGLSMVLEMGMLKLPQEAQTLLPFAIEFAAMFTFWRLNRRSELVVMRSAGFSVWQLLAPVFGVAVVIGVFYLSLLNPIGAAMQARYEMLEDRLIFHRTSSVTLLKEGLWLRQDAGDNHIILHADKIDLPAWVLHGVIAIYFGADDTYKQRLDAPRARLESGQWILEDARASAPRQEAKDIAQLSIPTDLTSRQIEESFSSPSTVSFWALPGFIETLEQTGFDATELKIYFNILLAQPLMFAAMILLAAAVSLRPPRFRGVFAMILAGVIAGFVVFFSASFLQALGVSHQIPVLAAAWTPPLVAALIGVAVVLNFEDG
jgi:lipopolysaccharide export system permease protein